MSTITRNRLGHRMAAKSGGLRKDIQGLRAVAVLVVVLDHLLGWPHGGFIGVDMFFVISGFLITDLMLREHSRTGRISYVGFYRRRVRRIIPLSSVVLIITVGTSYLVYRRARADIVFSDGLWALGFMSNWHFAAAKTDYFNNEGLVSPLQHFWSLAVEEQFYVAWPFIVIAIAMFAAGRMSHRRVLGAMLSCAVLMSFAFAMWQSTAEATQAYFSTGARAWELGVGALLAVGVNRVKRIPVILQPVLSWTGLTGVVASLVLISATSTFPAPWAALPVLSTALVIAAGAGGASRTLFLLTNPVSQYVGNVSYSLYLWHFPVIVLMSAYLPDAGKLQLAAAVLVTVVLLTVLSFHFVEDPIRRSTWLEPRSHHRRRVRYKDAFDPVVLRNFGVVALLTASAGTIALVVQVMRPAPTVSAAAASTIDVVAASSAGQQVKRQPKGPVDKLQAQIEDALAAAEFPDLVPTIDDLANNKAPQWTENGCGTTGAWNKDLCVYGAKGAKKTVAVIGDSIALSWLPGVIKAVNGDGYRVHSFVAGQCPAADVKVGDASAIAGCAKHRAWGIESIKTLDPDLIIVSDASFLMPKLASGAQGAAAGAEWRRGTVRTLSALRSVGKTVMLSSPPGSKNLLDCATVRASPQACEGRLDEERSTLLLEAETSAGEDTHVRLIDASQWFCGPDNRCPSFVGSTPVYVDGIHMTRQYSESLAPLLSKALGLDHM